MLRITHSQAVATLRVCRESAARTKPDGNFIDVLRGIMKMLKKLFWIGVIAGVAMVSVKAVKNTNISSAVRQEVAELRDWADSKVPVEKKIASLRKEVKFMDKDIEKAASELAREIVEVRELNREVLALRASVERQTKDVFARGEVIRDASEKVSSSKENGLTTSVNEAKELLKADVARLKDRQRSLESLEKTLATRERIKLSLENQLDTLKKKKLEVSASIDAAEAKFKDLQLQQMESKYQKDDTRLSKIKDSLRDLNKMLDIKAEELKLAPTVYEGSSLPASQQTIDDILAPVTGKGEIPTADE